MSLALSLIMTFSAFSLNVGLFSFSAAQTDGTSSELSHETVYALVGTGEAAPFEVTVTDALYPSGKLSLGGAYGVGGVIHSDSIIEKVVGGVYTSDGEKVIYHECEPHADNCSIYQNFDPVLTFNTLAVGDYVYMLLWVKAVSCSSLAISVTMDFSPRSR